MKQSLRHALAQSGMYKARQLVYKECGTSMVPTIPTNSFVTIKSLSQDKGVHAVQEGDIIFFRLPGKNRCLLHRVIQIRTDGMGNLQIVTKGDAKAFPDPPISASNILGIATHLHHDGKMRIISSRKKFTLTVLFNALLEGSRLLFTRSA